MTTTLFHRLIRQWFEGKYPAPTEIQAKAWKQIARGEHVLLSAPTGSGKTLTAFLWAVEQCITGKWQGRGVQVLYISPLKALNNDIYANLLVPLKEITGLFQAEGEAYVPVTAAVRSGDTTPSERRRMLKHPPEILITTPESLNILLTSQSGRGILTEVKSVILDEIHAIIGEKRGTHCITAIERLCHVAGEFQRIGISATIRPMERAAAFLGGSYPETPLDASIPAAPSAASRTASGKRLRGKRPVKIIGTKEEVKSYVLDVSLPEVDETTTAGAETGSGASFWERYVPDFLRIIDSNRSTLFFVTNRRAAEKITLLINKARDERLAYAHHGSLSKEVRYLVEQKLKAGELKAIVATNSLELGIDVGEIDQVVLVKTPNTIAGAVQRIGRAGHRVGQESRGSFYPIPGLDLLQALVMEKSVRRQDIEECCIPETPLDVLSQIVISIIQHGIWTEEALYALIRSSYPYTNLKRETLEKVLAMLEGKYGETNISALKPKVYIDEKGRIHPLKGTRQLLYHSGGTIPDRGYYTLRSQEGSPLGELDEEFVWERKIGESFVLGSNVWTITGIGKKEVDVIPAKPGAPLIPFWRAENLHRDFHLSLKALEFLLQWKGKFSSSQFMEACIREHHLNSTGAGELSHFLSLQEEHTGTSVPHRYNLVIEECRRQKDIREIVLHTLWGGRVNHPLAILISAFWEDRYGYPLPVFPDNDCILLQLPHDDEGVVRDALMELSALGEEDILSLLQKELEGSALFGARFRENAGRALLLPKGGFGKRVPLWLTRLRSKKLLAAVKRYDDFPILVETWRACLKDEFDLPSLSLVMDEIAQGRISLSECTTESPSPFASNVLWYKTNTYMYQGDEALPAGASTLNEQLLREVLFSEKERPLLDKEILEAYRKKQHRVAEGYPPTETVDLLSWISQRLLLPRDEWTELKEALKREFPEREEEYRRIIRETEKATVWWGEELPSLAHKDTLNRLKTPEWEKLLPEWLAYYGPVTLFRISRVFSLPVEELESILGPLAEEEILVRGRLSEAAEEEEVCLTENLEHLLRLSRWERRTQIEPLIPREFFYFLAERQGCCSREEKEDSSEDLQEVLELLFGFPARAELWEEDIFPSRLTFYDPSWLDSLLYSTPLFWYGRGKQRISFALSHEKELFLEPSLGEDGVNPNVERLRSILPSEASGKAVGFWEIHDALGISSDDVSSLLWESVWQGITGSVGFDSLRAGITRNFNFSSKGSSSNSSRHAPPKKERNFKGKHTRFSRWKAERQLTGSWFSLLGDRGEEREERLIIPQEEKDDLEELEANKERARQVLDRYGVVFPDLLDRETEAFTWRKLFPALRLMEFSGEVVGGRFVTQVRGAQFARREDIFRLSRFRGKGEEREDTSSNDPIFRINAADPASPCGISFPFANPYPPRVPSTYLIFHGSRLVIIAKRRGKDIQFLVDPESPDIDRYLESLIQLCTRKVRPLTRLRIESINDDHPHESPYTEKLLEKGFTKAPGALSFHKPL